MTDKEMFIQMLVHQGTEFDTDRWAYSEPGWTFVNFKVGAGLAGSSEGTMTAFFKPDGSFDGFYHCD